MKRGPCTPPGASPSLQHLLSVQSVGAARFIGAADSWPGTPRHSPPLPPKADVLSQAGSTSSVATDNGQSELAASTRLTRSRSQVGVAPSE